MADTIGDERRKARMVINELMHDQFTGSGSLAQQVERAHEVIAILEPYDDNYALARAWNEIVLREVARGQYAAATVASDRVVDYARLAGSERLARQVAPAVSYLMVHSATPVSEGIKGCDELLEGVRGNRKTEAIVLGALAQLKAMDGQFDEARRPVPAGPGDPRRAPAADRRELDVDRGVARRDPRRRPRGRRGDAPA